MPGVAILGGAGFIGSNLLDEVMAQNFKDVVVLDNLSQGNIGNIKRWNGHQNFSFIKGDVRDFNLVKRVCADRSIVFHLAACSRIQPLIKEPLLAWENNVAATGYVLEACRLGGVKRLVYTASSSAYGLNNQIPLTEDMNDDCLNPYSLSKKFGEEMCEVYHKLYGLSTVSLRLFNAYGPRNPEEGAYSVVMAIFRKQKRLGQPLTIVGDGTQRRDFTFVSDVVKALMMAAMNRDVNGTINIGTGKNYSINEIADIVAGPDYPRVNIEPRPGEAKATLAFVKKAKEQLGWCPSIDLEQGLEITDLFEKINPQSSIIIPGRL
jgi:UDP-glucose 4-epimerase